VHLETNHEFLPQTEKSSGASDKEIELDYYKTKTIKRVSLILDILVEVLTGEKGMH